MIKRLDLSANPRHEPRSSAGRDDSTDGGLFSNRKQFRKVVVLVDSELRTGGAPNGVSTEPADATSLLAGLLDHPLVSVLRYADKGPPSTVKPTSGPFGGEVFEGWAVLEDPDPRDGVWSVVYPTENG